MKNRINAIRMIDWIVYSILLCATIWFLAPHQLGVSLYKLSLVSLAAVVGYRIDRSLFPYARPDDLALAGGIETAGAQMRRAIIVAATIIGVSLGA